MSQSQSRPPRPGARSTEDLLTLLLDPKRREAFLNSWPVVRCALCETKAATGIWMCRFSKQSPPFFRAELKPLCPGCGFTDCYTRWNGFMCPKLVRCDLAFTITAPEGDKLTAADRIIDKLLSHPKGELAFNLWKEWYKPANIHHPIQPAMLMLIALRDKFFPPETPKAESTTEASPA